MSPTPSRPPPMTPSSPPTISSSRRTSARPRARRVSGWPSWPCRTSSRRSTATRCPTRSRPEMRVAVVDIGSNSTRLLVAELEQGRVREELVRRSTVTRLGAGVDAEGRLSKEAMERVHRTLQEYHELIEECGAQKRVAVLTSAVRDAANGEEFAQAVKERYGLEPHVLEGEQEARLTFLGATSERDPEDRTPTVVSDIGGGSTHVAIGAGQAARFP